MYQRTKPTWEVFGGAAWFLFAKSRSGVEVYNDVHPGLANLFSVLQDPVLFERFYRRILVAPYSRSEFYNSREEWENQTDKVEMAAQWLIAICQSFSSTFTGGWCFSVVTSVAIKWYNRLRRLREVHERLQSVRIENEDWRVILDKYDSEDTFFYLDPPYVHETRSDARYVYEINDADHVDLINRIQNLKGKVLLSGFANSIYENLDWQTDTFSIPLRSTNKETGKQQRYGDEVLWRNFETQQLLFEEVL